MITAVNNYVTMRLLEENTPWAVVDNIKINMQGWAEILTVGPGLEDSACSNPDPVVAPGDIVYANRHGQVKFRDIHFLSEYDIMIKIENGHVKPLGPFILIEVYKPEEISEEGIFIPENLRERICTGKVLTLGTGWRDMNREIIPFHVQPGDSIVFRPSALIPINGESVNLGEIHLVQHMDILGKLE